MREMERSEMETSEKEVRNLNTSTEVPHRQRNNELVW